MRMKTKALLACSVTIVLLLGVGVGIASAAPPVIDDDCQCCGFPHTANTAPFCWGRPKQYPNWLGNARVAAACLVACLRNADFDCFSYV